MDLAKSATQMFDELAAAPRQKILRFGLLLWQGPERKTDVTLRVDV